MESIQPYLQPIVIIAAMAGMLKFLVVDKLKTITAGISSHEKRIRRQELLTARLHGALSAKGCIRGESCPAADMDDDEEILP